MLYYLIKNVYLSNTGIEWMKGHSDSHDLVMLLRKQGQLELWDAFSGVCLWKKQFTESLLSISLDPFDFKRILCMCLYVFWV